MRDKISKWYAIAIVVLSLGFNGYFGYHGLKAYVYKKGYEEGIGEGSRRVMAELIRQYNLGKVEITSGDNKMVLVPLKK